MQRGLLLALVLTSAVACAPSGPRLPATLADDEFWTLSTALSEPPGPFTHSDNLVSNEAHYVHSVRLLRRAGGVYIGVGPEQNFSYIARVRPAMAFIIDIRQENRSLHLMYKALFALSADRADFLSRLFSRERPADLSTDATVHDLFARYDSAAPAVRRHDTGLASIRHQLIERQRFPLSPQDLDWIGFAFRKFYTDGPDIRYARSHPGDSPAPTYRALMTAADASGQAHSYLASEAAFAFVKDLHARNLIVPVVGDFSGPDAIRRTADYIREHGAVVSAFYASNVEVYLNREKKRAYCANLATLPHRARSWFIASRGMQPLPVKLKSCLPADR